MDNRRQSTRSTLRPNSLLFFRIGWGSSPFVEKGVINSSMTTWIQILASIVLLLLSRSCSSFPADQPQHIASPQDSLLSAAPREQPPDIVANYEYVTSLAQVRALGESVRKQLFPQLATASIQYKIFSSKEYFFEAQFSLRRRSKRTYSIKVSRHLFSQRCPLEAVRGILAHEFAHIDDYDQRSGLGIALLGTRMIFRRSREKYEKRTDIKGLLFAAEKNLHRQYAENLITYRQWLYKHLPPKKLVKKKRIYFTPKEIVLILERINASLHANKIHQLQKIWLSHPPRTIQDINKPIPSQ